MKRYKNILDLSEFFLSLASEELPENSEDLKIILGNLEKLETYSARKKYAEKNLKHLSSGSSRIVYLTPNNTVIKLAKNDKGIAQNKAESNPKMISKFLNKILNHASNFSWIETKFLEKITPKQFEDMTKMFFDDFGDVLKYSLKSVSGNSDREKPKNFDDLKNAEIIKELTRLGKDFDLMPGDMTRISSFGKLEDHPVLIDSGLTKKVFEDFYDSSSS